MYVHVRSLGENPIEASWPLVKLLRERIGEAPSTVRELLPKHPSFGPVVLEQMRALLDDALRAHLKRLHPAVERWQYEISTERNGVQSVLLRGLLYAEQPPAARRKVRNLSVQAVPLDELPTLVIDERQISHRFGRIRCETVQVALTQPLFDELARERQFSFDFEEGGFLAGHAFRRTDGPGHIVVITDLISAQQTAASYAHLTLSAESLADAKLALRRMTRGQVLTGWYHTHLFAATDDFGLSDIDDHTHFTTFGIPWQVAGLLNITPEERTLRFYARIEDEMRECGVVVVSSLAAAAPEHGRRQ